MNQGDTEIVPAVTAALVEQFGRERFELWFASGTRMTYAGGCLKIEAANPFVADCLRLNFRQEIETACRQALGRDLPLEFASQAAPCSLPGAVADVQRETANSQAGSLPETVDSPDVIKIASPVVQVPASPTRGGRPFARLESFVVGRSNRLAFTSSQLVGEQLGHANPLFVYGPTGVGKTHLLEGVWCDVKRRQAGRHAVYLSAEQFTTYFLEALRGSGLPSFRRKHRGVDLLLIDDVQFLCGKRATIVELLHTIDALLRDGRQLVLSADRAPGDLSGLGAELLTRLEGGLACRLDPPDYETRLGIVRQMAGRMKLTLPEVIAEFVASRLTTHARELLGALNCLQATSLALREPITVSLAETALADMIRHSSRAVKLGDIEQAVCEVFGLDAATLQGSGKSKNVNHPRMLAMWLARKHTRAALSEIGRYFGRRSHSTVVTAQKKVNSWMAAGGPVQIVDRNWTVEEAIRRVEEQLRAG